MIVATTRSRLTLRAQARFWGYLGLIALAELLTAAIHTPSGLVLHAALLVALALDGALADDATARRLALTLLPAPLIRLLSLTLPLAQLPQLFWYPLVALPLFAAIAVVIRQGRFTREELGLRWGRVPLELALAGYGFGLGALEYLILRPVPLIAEPQLLPLLLAALSLLIFTGFSEELLFRGLIQSAGRRLFGDGGALLFGAALFAALHIGYLSLLDLLFVFVVGLLFGAIVLRGGSILGVTLAHGTTNITLFLLMPHAAAEPHGTFAAFTWALVWGGSAVGLLAIAVMLVRPQS